MIREILIGSGLALVVFLAILGIDVTPLVLLGVIILLIKFMMDSRGAGKKFEVVGSEGAPAVTSGVTFDDIGGQEVAKREFREALDFIKNAEQVAKLGIRPLKGILLSGPPGTGKTLMAKAAASHTGSAFLATSGSQFVEMYAGVGAQRVRKLFQSARTAAERQKATSAIIFVDEIEVLGGKRGKHSSHLEYDQTLNQLLVEMDGIQADDEIRVLVVGATNRPDLLDSALLRPGRFDRTVNVDLPDREGRLHILKIHAKGKPISADVNLETIAKDAFGFSGAHLESLVNEAAIHAMRENKMEIGAYDFKEAIDKVMMGEKLDRKPRRSERTRIAYHETGHALLSELVRPESVSTITVTSRGRALGYMRQTPGDDQYLYTQEELLGQVSILLGGALVEELFFGSRSTGSAGDFDQAVQLAEKMVYAGMSDLGVVNRANLPAEALHGEIQAIIKRQETWARKQLQTRRDLIDQIGQYLLENEKMSGADFREQLLASVPVEVSSETEAETRAQTEVRTDDVKAS